VPHYADGGFASWLAPPAVGINDLPIEYDYVRF
jgi:benzoyl-CoA 2,3-dioxygenase component B